MALPPQDTIKPPPKKMMETTIKEAFKKYNTWALVIIFGIEVLSYLLWDNETYKDFYYPLLNQITIGLLLLNVYGWRKRLNFCKYKSRSILLMVAYYFTGALAMIFKIEAFIMYVQLFFFIMALAFFIFLSEKKT